MATTTIWADIASRVACDEDVVAIIPAGADPHAFEPSLRDREMVVKLFAELGPRYANRNGGYLRILKMGFRVGDNAPMAFIELLDRPEITEAVEDTSAD